MPTPPNEPDPTMSTPMRRTHPGTLGVDPEVTVAVVFQEPPSAGSPNLKAIARLLAAMALEGREGLSPAPSTSHS